jgi:hypothetical protein
MASSIPFDLSTQLEYYAIRDTLLGRNYVKQDVKRALELASTCQHPDAMWLSKVFAGKDVTTKEEARDVFLAHGDDDARALCFSALLSLSWDHARLRRAAEMDFAFAQAVVAGLGTAYEERFSLSLRASLQGERDGFYSLGWCYEHRVGCEQDVTKANENYLLAAKLNHVDAMLQYGHLLDEKDPQRWHWWGVAAARGYPNAFLSKFGSVVDRVSSDPSLAPALFMIGRALKGHINTERKTIFGKPSLNYDSRIGPANRAVEFFSFQCAAARAAVDTWCLMAVRINGKVNRDIRKKIGMLIWEARELGNYKENSADEVASQSKRRRPS